jgi:hypothetical protein
VGVKKSTPEFLDNLSKKGGHRRSAGYGLNPDFDGAALLEDPKSLYFKGHFRTFCREIRAVGDAVIGNLLIRLRSQGWASCPALACAAQSCRTRTMWRAGPVGVEMRTFGAYLDRGRMLP